MIAVAAILLVLGYVAYNMDPSLGGLLGRREGFYAATPAEAAAAAAAKAAADALAAKTAADAAAAAAKPTVSMGDASGTLTPGGVITAIPAPAVTPTVPTPAAPQGFKNGGSKKGANEGFADLASMEGPAAFASAEAPAGCYPRDQLTPIELLPLDQKDSIYAQQNPMGVGSLKGKNFLSAGALIGVNTVGQSLRNANLQLRSEPPNPQTPVSIFFQSTIGPDVSHRPLEVGA
jgi:hypothetical protein